MVENCQLCDCELLDMMEGEEKYVISSPDEKGICSDTVRIKVLNVS